MTGTKKPRWYGETYVWNEKHTGIIEGIRIEILLGEGIIVLVGLIVMLYRKLKSICIERIEVAKSTRAIFDLKIIGQLSNLHGHVIYQNEGKTFEIFIINFNPKIISLIYQFTLLN